MKQIFWKCYKKLLVKKQLESAETSEIGNSGFGYRLATQSKLNLLKLQRQADWIYDPNS